MTNLEDQFKNNEDFNRWQKNQSKGRIAAGVFVILAGIVYLYKQMGYFIPEWFFTWPTLLIAIGIVSGIKHNFKSAKWLILILIGSLFLSVHFFAELTVLQYKIPIILFIVGIVLILKPKNRYRQYNRFNCRQNTNWHKGADSSVNKNSDDYIFANNIFSGTDKNIFTKDFKGGEIKNTFGGCKVNLMQADIVSEAVLTIKQQFGGVKLIIPPHWIIKSDIDCVFAGIEDKRPILNVNDMAQAKTLVLNGHIFMSGIEIVSY